MTARHLQFGFAFPRNYEVKALESYGLVHPAEKLYHFPTELEEGDRRGLYARVVPENGPPWVGFFALGFDSDQVAAGLYSCPDPDRLCVVTGGYGYVVNTRNPLEWFQLQQRPVIEVRSLPELQLLVFAGFTEISGLGPSGPPWVTERLSWEGLSITEIQGHTLRGLGWDALTDKEVPFEVDLRTGESRGGARPQGSK